MAAAALAAKKGKGDAPEGSPGKSIKAKLQVGDFVEVKWGVDWWHAQVDLIPPCLLPKPPCAPSALRWGLTKRPSLESHRARRARIAGWSSACRG